MNTTEKNMAIKAQAMDAITMPDGVVQIGDFTYAIPVEVDGEARWAKFELTATNNKDTKTTKAFDPFEKQNEWRDVLAERAAKAEAKAKEKEAKAAAKVE